jgi:hypothetical protein
MEVMEHREVITEGTVMNTEASAAVVMDEERKEIVDGDGEAVVTEEEVDGVVGVGNLLQLSIIPIIHQYSQIMVHQPFTHLLLSTLRSITTQSMEDGVGVAVAVAVVAVVDGVGKTQIGSKSNNMKQIGTWQRSQNLWIS